MHCCCAVVLMMSRCNLSCYPPQLCLQIKASEAELGPGASSAYQRLYQRGSGTTAKRQVGCGGLTMAVRQCCCRWGAGAAGAAAAPGLCWGWCQPPAMLQAHPLQPSGSPRPPATARSSSCPKSSPPLHLHKHTAPLTAAFLPPSRTPAACPLSKLPYRSAWQQSVVSRTRQRWRSAASAPASTPAPPAWLSSASRSRGWVALCWAVLQDSTASSSACDTLFLEVSSVQRLQRPGCRARTAL